MVPGFSTTSPEVRRSDPDARGDGRPSFLDPARFPFTRALERNAPEVRSELERMLTGSFFRPWPETGLYDQGWEVFGLYFFGKRIDENCARCPRTTAIVESVPGMTTAGFSRMAPGTRIKPHVGFTDKVLRCHLGLIVPPACALKVGGETRSWRENECLIFDDTLEHEAWNESDETRIVLLLDFERAGWREPAPAGRAVPGSAAAPGESRG